MLSKQSNLNSRQVKENSNDFSDDHRQANFLSLVTLQNKVPKALFQEMIAHIDQAQDLPHRVAWDGSSSNCSFEELRLISGHQNSEALSFLLNNQDKLCTKIRQFEAAKNSRKYAVNPVEETNRKAHLCSFDRNMSRLVNVCNFKKRNSLNLQFSNQLVKSKANAIREHLSNDHGLYHRMKTVFGHAIIQDGAGTPVYNCQFDQSGKFIITGADDGIIKVWSKDTMILQASLHGHMDMIIDIAVSKCNRFMASGSKDGVLILWDLQNCTIIKKLEHYHTSQINRLRFVMVRSNTKQAYKNLTSGSKTVMSDLSTAPMVSNLSHHGGQQTQRQPPTTYDQFLVSCSDDGSVIIYDVSSFLKASIDEFYVLEDGVYLPMHRNKVNQTEQDQLVEGLKQVATISADDEADRIARRTRKRNMPVTGGITNQTTANSSSQSQNNSQESQIFHVKLRPEDFRAGTRNKHIDSVSISPKGFIAGGTNHGEIYLWKVNFGTIRQRKSDGHYSWINSFKVHKKANHYLEFDKTGDLLMSGSADGTACVWNTSFVDRAHFTPNKLNIVAGAEATDEIRESTVAENILPAKDIDISDETLVYKFTEKNTKHKLECQIDSIAWSANGRYAIVAMGVKKLEEEDTPQKKETKTKPAIVKVKVFDTYSGKVIENLDKACCLGKSMANFVSIVKPHPFNDDVVLCCFDGGVNILYDIRQQRVLQEIVEYGIYSIDQFTMNNQMDADFTKDGDFIALSSVFGTLSLYSTQAQRKSRYSCTRVQQFFPYDNQMHDSNVYEAQLTQPQLCGYELNPYEVQPTAPIIGKYAKQEGLQMTPQEFERMEMFAKEFAAEEERFYQDQLIDGMREGYFETAANMQPDEQAGQRLMSELVSPVRTSALQFMDADMHEGSDEDLIGGTRVMRARRAARIGDARRRLARTDEQPEDVDASDDEDFEDDRSVEEGDHEDDQSHDSFASIDSELNFHNRLPSYMQPENTRRANYHELDQDEVNNRLQQIEETHRLRTRTRDRAPQDEGQRERNNERYSLRRPVITSQSTQQEQVTTAATARGAGTRRLRRVVHSGETSQDRQDDESNFGEGGRRGLRQGLRRGRRGVQHVDLISSADHSARSFMSDQESDMPVRGRRSRNRNEPAARTSRNRVVARRNLRDRASDESGTEGSAQSFASESNADMTEDLPVHRTKDDEKLEIMITECRMFANSDLERDDSYSQRGSKSKKGAIIIKEGRFHAAKEGPGDEVYILEQDVATPPDACCFFCQRTMDNHVMIGPFKPKHSIDIAASIDPNGLWFHNDCLEKNAYVKYSKTAGGGKWTNIQAAIKYLVEYKSYTCYRCLGSGATVQCNSCYRSFHGHFCNNLYQLSFADSEYRCIFCQNQTNYNQDIKKLVQYQNTAIPDSRKKISRDQLLSTEQYTAESFYMPQIGDEVMYFFQGHEQFHQSMNCFFYAGQQELMGSTDLPWMHLPYLKNAPSGQVACEVVDICHKFANARAEKLIKEFGECSFEGVTQRSSIITYVELQIIDENVIGKKRTSRFVVPIFPCEAANYIVPLCLFEQKIKSFVKSRDTIVGKRFKTTLGQALFDGREVQVIAVNQVEPDQYPQSQWKTILVTEVPMVASRPSRGRPSLQLQLEDAVRINFWDLVFQGEEALDVPCAFDKYEIARLIDCLTLFFSKKLDLIEEFLARVDVKIAADYLSYIPAEMWLQLVFERIQNNYYRSQDQLWFDLDLIPYCSNIYNGPEDLLTLRAKNMVEKVRKELKLHINTNNERASIKNKSKNRGTAGLMIGENGSINDFGFGKEKSASALTKFGSLLSIGEGGATNFKKIFEETLQDSQPKERVTYDANEGLLTLDPTVPLILQPEQVVRKRGRPPKRQKLNSGDEPSFEFNAEQSVTPNSNEVITPEITRRSLRKSNRGTTTLGKRSRQEMEEADSDFVELDNEEPYSNQENTAQNNQPSLKIVIDCEPQQDSYYASGRPKRQRLVDQ